ncbi:MAG: hypothetical protein LBS52_02460 [Dysgonamonadaceae bacterium]|nr:hypothetical protein [Dysgonamonadaceae bacterium]
MGGGRGMGGGNRQGPPSGMGQRGGQSRGNVEFRLDSFPEIRQITLEQRADIGIILAKEQKSIFKLFEKKRELMDKEPQTAEMSEKDRAKMQENLAKIDEKIAKRKEKSNKKIKKILSAEQYQIFLEKRNDFRFTPVPPEGFNPQEGDGEFRGRQGGRPQGGGFGGGQF